MRIIDVNIDQLKATGRRGRARSAETEQLIAAITALKSGSAKAIMIGSGDTAPKVRARVAYASRLAGKRLQIAVQEDRVLFALSRRKFGKRRKQVVAAKKK